MPYSIIVNGETVWKFEDDAILIDRISISTKRGEAASIGSAHDNDELLITVNVRDPELTSDLDILEARKAQERRDANESVPDLVFEEPEAVEAPEAPKAKKSKKEVEPVEELEL